jgi:hypothetical protein
MRVRRPPAGDQRARGAEEAAQARQTDANCDVSIAAFQLKVVKGARQMSLFWRDKSVLVTGATSRT